MHTNPWELRPKSKRDFKIHAIDRMFEVTDRLFIEGDYWKSICCWGRYEVYVYNLRGEENTIKLSYHWESRGGPSGWVDVQEDEDAKHYSAKAVQAFNKFVNVAQANPPASTQADRERAVSQVRGLENDPLGPDADSSRAWLILCSMMVIKQPPEPSAHGV